MEFDILKIITLFSDNSKFEYAGICWWAEVIKS